jgi:hypothetical protein
MSGQCRLPLLTQALETRTNTGFPWSRGATVERPNPAIEKGKVNIMVIAEKLRRPRRALVACAVFAAATLGGLVASPVADAAGTPDQTSASAPAPAYYRIINKVSGKCLTQWGPGDGAAITQFTCDGGADQKWSIDLATVGTIVNFATGDCLDLFGNGNADGQLVSTWSCYGAASQVWRPVNVGAQYYELRPYYTDKCLDLLNGMLGNGATIVQWGCHIFNDNQQWRIVQ